MGGSTDHEDCSHCVPDEEKSQTEDDFAHHQDQGNQQNQAEDTDGDPAILVRSQVLGRKGVAVVEVENR